MRDQNYIQFESYLSNTLSKDEVQAFESRLQTDVEFNKAFQTYKELSSFLAHKFENEEASAAFKNNLSAISNNYFKDKKPVKKTIRFKPWQYAIAASVALLVGVFVFNNLSHPSFSDYNDYNTISLTVRGNDNSLLQTAENAFNNKNYAKAADAFKSLIALDETNSELKLYGAISNIELGNYQLAESLLADLRDGQSAFKHKATWYLALSKLKQKNYKVCITILMTIPDDAEDYERAQELIDKLD